MVERICGICLFLKTNKKRSRYPAVGRRGMKIMMTQNKLIGKISNTSIFRLPKQR